MPPLSGGTWLDGGALSVPREASGWRPEMGLPFDARRPHAGEARPRPRPGSEAATSGGSGGAVGTASGTGLGTDFQTGTTGGGFMPGVVGVSRLDGPDPDRAGLIPAEDAGLPRAFWQGTTLAEAEAAIRAPAPRLPVLDDVFRQVLTAQTTPPERTEDEQGTLFLARVDALMALGSADAAAALLDAAGTETAPAFARRMDAALLMGDERRACARLAEAPGLAPDLATRVYCLAQSGDWSAAALILRGGLATGAIPADLGALLTAFLDDAQVDEGGALTPPQPMTPLAFRLLEAAGQPVPTSTLPVPYALADLRANTGWKPRIEAAERLARAGDLDGFRLRAIYSEQPPAASGGVWDRVAAVQRLEAALSLGEAGAIAAALPPAHEAMAAGGLAAPFAQMFGAPLMAADLPGEAGDLAERLALASGDPAAWAAVALLSAAQDPARAWLRALATDAPLPDAGAPTDDLGAALAAALAATPSDAVSPAPDVPALPDTGFGPAFLAALRDVDAGREGDVMRAARGISTLRALGHGMADHGNMDHGGTAGAQGSMIAAERLARAATLQLLLLAHGDAMR